MSKDNIVELLHRLRDRYAPAGLIVTTRQALIEAVRDTPYSVYQPPEDYVDNLVNNLHAQSR